MYKVIKYFTDTQDRGFAYDVGDTYPRAGLTVSGSRIKELAGSNNRQQTPLIVEVEEPKRKSKSADVADAE